MYKKGGGGTPLGQADGDIVYFRRSRGSEIEEAITLRKMTLVCTPDEVQEAEEKKPLRCGRRHYCTSGEVQEAEEKKSLRCGR